jgi:hypothetical protein
MAPGRVTIADNTDILTPVHSYMYVYMYNWIRK